MEPKHGYSLAEEKFIVNVGRINQCTSEAIEQQSSSPQEHHHHNNVVI